MHGRKINAHIIMHVVPNLVRKHAMMQMLTPMLIHMIKPSCIVVSVVLKHVFVVCCCCVLMLCLCVVVCVCVLCCCVII